MVSLRISRWARMDLTQRRSGAGQARTLVRPFTYREKMGSRGLWLGMLGKSKKMEPAPAGYSTLGRL